MSEVYFDFGIICFFSGTILESLFLSYNISSSKRLGNYDLKLFRALDRIHMSHILVIS